MKTKLTVKQIKEIQKDLHSSGILEEYVDYRLSEEYMNLFLEKYSELEGRHGYIQGATIISLLELIKKKAPALSEKKKIKKVQTAYPIIRSMLIREKVFEVINKARKKYNNGHK